MNNNTHSKEGICPNCDFEGPSRKVKSVTTAGVIFECVCNNCGQRFNEVYSLEFLYQVIPMGKGEDVELKTLPGFPKEITIEVYNGVVNEVTGLPDNWQYKVKEVE